MTNKYERERLARKFNKSKHWPEINKTTVNKNKEEVRAMPNNRDLLGNLALSYDGSKYDFRCPFDNNLCESSDLYYNEDDEPFDGKMTCSTFEGESFFRCERLPDGEFNAFLKRNKITFDMNSDK